MLQKHSYLIATLLPSITTGRNLYESSADNDNMLSEARIPLAQSKSSEPSILDSEPKRGGVCAPNLISSWIKQTLCELH